MKPSAIARSGVTTPMPTVRCFQMRFSVRSSSYSSTHLREAIREVVDEIEQRALPVLVQRVELRSAPQLRRLVLRHAVRQVAVHAARTVVRRVHARARHRFVHVEEILALAERVQEGRHRADVERMRAEPQQVIQDARDLVEHHADVLRALRDVDPEQTLDGEAVGVLVAHHGHVVETVHVRQRLDVGLVLGELLGRAMQEPDVRVGALDDFAVELEHEAQHAVGRRVLRSKVHGVVANFSHEFCVQQ